MNPSQEHPYGIQRASASEWGLQRTGVGLGWNQPVSIACKWLGPPRKGVTKIDCCVALFCHDCSPCVTKSLNQQKQPKDDDNNNE